MLAKFEHKTFEAGCKVWVKKYVGLMNVPHWHYETELVACFSGSAIIQLDGQQYTLDAGKSVFIRGESVHSITGSQDSKIIVAQYERSLWPGSTQFLLPQPVFPDRYDAYARMDEIYREIKDAMPFYEEITNAAMIQLIADILRGEPHAKSGTEKKTVMARYSELLAEIEHSVADISFEDAASFMNMSTAYFSRFFKKVSGMTFSRYLNVIRVGKAIELVSSLPDIAMGTVMMECGFNTIRSFNRVFKDITGYAPSQLPKEYKLNYRSFSTYEDDFDPTMDQSIILP